MVFLSQITLLFTLLYVFTLFVFFVGIHLRRKSVNKEILSASVIIAARNEEKNIENILNDLVCQTYPVDKFEIIVADDGSTDKTANIVERFSQKFNNIRLIQVSKIPTGFSPKKYVLQSAIRMSRSDIILATDADCRVGSRWIETMVSCFTPKVGFVVGFSQYGKPGEKQNLVENLQALDFLQLMSATAATCNLGMPLAASGQNLAYRRTAFEMVGGYKKVADRISGDDVLLLQLIRKYTPFKTVFAFSDAAFAVSEPQPTLNSLINQRKRWASNGSYQLKQNIPFFIYLVLVLMSNLFLFFGFALAAIFGSYLSVFTVCLAAKAAAELLVGFTGAKIFKRQDLLRFFPLWFILQMPYIVIVGLAGTFGNYNWKGRDHAASVGPVKPLLQKFVSIWKKF